MMLRKFRHRTRWFRHSFARISLTHPGVTVRDVAELLSNTEEMLRKALRGLDTGAAEAIDRRIEAAFETKPNEIAMPPPARA